MKIIQIIYGLSTGGAERLVVDLSNEMVKEHEVYLLILKDENIDDYSFYKNQLSNDIKYINAGIKKGFTVKEAINLYKTIKSIQPDVVHIHLKNTVFYIILSILFFRKPIYIETLHSRADKVDDNRFSHIIKYWLYRLGLVRLCTISKDNRDSFIKHYKLNDTAMISNSRARPKSTENFESVKNEISLLKKKSDDIVFLHVGRCVEAKNQRTLIRTFNRLYKSNQKFILIIIGSGFNSEEGLYLKKTACPNIHFIGTRINVSDYFILADAFCLSSIFEGMPITLIEAFACGCIPISTPVSGAIDIIKDSDTGFLSKDFSEESYYDSLINYIDNYKCIDKQKLIKFYDENFTVEQCVKSYLAVYKK